MWYKVQKIYLGDKLVRPSGWKPGANTIAYYKLDGNTNDYLWNYNWTWSWTSAYKTLSSWIQVAYMPESNKLSYIYSSCQVLPKTVSFWFQKENRYWDGSWATDWVQLIWQCNSESGNWQLRFNLVPSAVKFKIRNSSWENDIWWLVPDSWNTNWHNIVFTLTNWDNKLYYDSVLFGTLWWNCTVWWNLYMWGNPFGLNGTYKRQLAWCMSEVILEDKVRTAEEIQAYYNQTKSNYWL